MHRHMIGFVFVALVSLGLAPLAADETEKKSDDGPGGLFSKLDANQDGVVTKDEVPEDEGRKFERLLRAADKNEDGQLTREEFAAGLKSDRPQRPLERKQPAEASPAEQAKFLFRRVDANGNGKVEADEVPADRKEFFQKLIERADGDGDGALSREEFVKVAPAILETVQAKGAPGAGRRAAEFFGRLDSDGDGKVALADVPEEHRERFQHLLKAAGKGEDGALTKEEFLRAAVRLAQRAAGRPEAGARPGPGLALMRALDANKDGELSAEEIAAASSALQELDKNEDGKVARDELAPRGGPGAGGRPFSPEQFVQRVLQLDQDGDGKISKDEARGPLEANFAEVDANNDGQLDRDELTQRVEALAKKFRAGSEDRRKQFEERRKELKDRLEKKRSSKEGEKREKKAAEEGSKE